MDNKVCSKCGKLKLLSEFHKDKYKVDGHRPDCKECLKNYREKYPWKFILKSIKKRCYDKNSENYKWYGLKGIKCLIIVEELKFLWYRDKAYDMKQPSIDREDSDGDYILSNCRFIEMFDNISRQDRSKSFKAIIQYDLNDNFIKEFKNIGDASRELNTSHCNITDVLHKRQKTAKGFKWRFKNA